MITRNKKIHKKPAKKGLRLQKERVHEFRKNFSRNTFKIFTEKKKKWKKPSPKKYIYYRF